MFYFFLYNAARISNYMSDLIGGRRSNFYRMYLIVFIKKRLCWELRLMKGKIFLANIPVTLAFFFLNFKAFLLLINNIKHCMFMCLFVLNNGNDWPK